MATFSRAMRMNNPSDYTRVFRQAKRSGGGGLTILTVENTVGHPRLGLAIAKKQIAVTAWFILFLRNGIFALECFIKSYSVGLIQA